MVCRIAHRQNYLVSQVFITDSTRHLGTSVIIRQFQRYPHFNRVCSLRLVESSIKAGTVPHMPCGDSPKNSVREPENNVFSTVNFSYSRY
jgi:hypothetical protein